MITHDRYFLDSVTNRIVELDNGKLYSYQANYEGFLELKAERVDMEKASERKRQSILRDSLPGCSAARIYADQRLTVFSSNHRT